MKTLFVAADVRRLILFVLLVFLTAKSTHGQGRSPINRGYLQSDLDANGKAITNLAGLSGSFTLSQTSIAGLVSALTSLTNYVDAQIAGVTPAAGNGTVLSGTTIHLGQSAAYTPGRIPFASGTTTIGFDSSFLWDSTNNMLGLLSAVPTHTVTIGSAGNGMAIYGTTDQTTNFERMTVNWDGVSTYNILSESGGTGVVRDLVIGNGNTSIDIGLTGVNGAIQSSTSTGSHFLWYGSFGASSGTQPLFEVQASINQSGTAGYSLFNIDAVENSVGSGPRYLINAKIAGQSKFLVDHLGHIGVGTTTPAASSLIDLASTNRGFLMPRMTSTQRDAISSPATGLLIVNTTTSGIDMYNGSSWVALVSGSVGTVSSVALSVPSWLSVSGSPVTSSGTLAVSAATGQTANQVLATPDGTSGAVGLRALVAADIPSLAASKITSGTIDTARLGTGTANSTTYLAGDQTYKTAVTATTTDTFQNKTITSTAAGGNNTVKLRNYIVLAFPHNCDGAGAIIATNDNTAKYFGQAAFSGSAGTNANWIEYRLTVPEDIDTSVDLKVERWKVRLGAGDTAAHIYDIGMASVADSASYDSPTFGQWAALSLSADASGASGDVETVSNVTLTGWRSNVTAGQLWVIRVNRDGNADASTQASYSGPLVISYGSTQ